MSPRRRSRAGDIAVVKVLETYRLTTTGEESSVRYYRIAEVGRVDHAGQPECFHGPGGCLEYDTPGLEIEDCWTESAEGYFVDDLLRDLPILCEEGKLYRMSDVKGALDRYRRPPEPRARQRRARTPRRPRTREEPPCSGIFTRGDRLEAWYIPEGLGARQLGACRLWVDCHLVDEWRAAMWLRIIRLRHRQHGCDACHEVPVPTCTMREAWSAIMPIMAIATEILSTLT